MGAHYNARKRQLAKFGRAMVLRRYTSTTATTEVTVQGYLTMFAPEQIGIGAVVEGDAQVTIGNDEIASAAWPGPPRVGDRLWVDGRMWTLRGVTPVYEGSACIGFTLFVRGG